MKRANAHLMWSAAFAGIALIGSSGYQAARLRFAPNSHTFAVPLPGVRAPQMSGSNSAWPRIHRFWPRISATMFAGPGASASVPMAASLQPDGSVAPEESPSAGDPLADYAYTGSVTIDGRTLALIENHRTHEGWYVAAGDGWQQNEIQTVSTDEIRMVVNGNVRTLARSESFNAVPPSADAPGTRVEPGSQDRGSEGASGRIDKLIAQKLNGITLTANDDPAQSLLDSGAVQIQSFDLVLDGTKAGVEQPMPAPAEAHQVEELSLESQVIMDTELDVTKL